MGHEEGFTLNDPPPLFQFFFQLGMSIESEVDLSQCSCLELKSSPIKPHKNSTFSQYREHEVRYKKYTEDIVNMATLYSMC